MLTLLLSLLLLLILLQGRVYSLFGVRHFHLICIQMYPIIEILPRYILTEISSLYCLSHYLFNWGHPGHPGPLCLRHHHSYSSLSYSEYHTDPLTYSYSAYSWFNWCQVGHPGPFAYAITMPPHPNPFLAFLVFLIHISYLIHLHSYIFSIIIIIMLQAIAHDDHHHHHQPNFPFDPQSLPHLCDNNQT